MEIGLQPIGQFSPHHFIKILTPFASALRTCDVPSLPFSSRMESVERVMTRERRGIFCIPAYEKLRWIAGRAEYRDDQPPSYN